MRSFALLCGLGVLGLMGCTGGGDSGGSGGSGGSGEPEKKTLDIKTPEYDVPAGESFECFYTDVVTEEELSVVAAAGIQGEGGHHIIVYYADEVRDPEHHPCDDAEMASWHQVVGANGLGTGEPAISMPEGLAIRVPKGKQIVLQTHYINTTGETQKYHDEVAVELTEPDKVVAYANLFAVADMGFTVDPHATTTHVTQTTVKRDTQIILMGGHMHERGQSFKLEMLDDAGEVSEVMYDEKWSAAYASHPPLLTYTIDDPRLLKKGTKLRQTCVWNNESADALQFPTEMCVTFGFYFPDDGELVHLATPVQ